MQELRGKIFNIQRFSVHDGPGIRTTVFMKGCNLRCRWCHNPESYERRTQIRYFPEKCRECGACAVVCQEKIEVRGKVRQNADRCAGCGRCAKECVYDALVCLGEERTVDEVMDIVVRDRKYFDRSGGGMTVSGGEPLFWPEFVRDLMARAKETGIGTALDTAFAVPYEAFEQVRPYVDLVLLDLKIMDEKTHEQFTGKSNARILENAKRLFSEGIRTQVRVPVIAGVNDSTENAEMLRDFLKGYDCVEEVRLLPYHNMGIGKADGLGMRMEEFAPPDDERMEKLREILKR